MNNRGGHLKFSAALVLRAARPADSRRSTRSPRMQRSWTPLVARGWRSVTLWFGVRSARCGNGLERSNVPISSGSVPLVRQFVRARVAVIRWWQRR